MVVFSGHMSCQYAPLWRRWSRFSDGLLAQTSGSPRRLRNPVRLAAARRLLPRACPPPSIAGRGYGSPFTLPGRLRGGGGGAALAVAASGGGSCWETPHTPLAGRPAAAKTVTGTLHDWVARGPRAVAGGDWAATAVTLGRVAVEVVTTARRGVAVTGDARAARAALAAKGGAPRLVAARAVAARLHWGRRPVPATDGRRRLGQGTQPKAEPREPDVTTAPSPPPGCGGGAVQPTAEPWELFVTDAPSPPPPSPPPASATPSPSAG